MEWKKKQEKASPARHDNRFAACQGEKHVMTRGKRGSLKGSRVKNLNA